MFSKAQLEILNRSYQKRNWLKYNKNACIQLFTGSDLISLPYKSRFMLYGVQKDLYVYDSANLKALIAFIIDDCKYNKNYNVIGLLIQYCTTLNKVQIWRLCINKLKYTYAEFDKLLSQGEIKTDDWIQAINNTTLSRNALIDIIYDNSKKNNEIRGCATYDIGGGLCIVDTSIEYIHIQKD